MLTPDERYSLLETRFIALRKKLSACDICPHLCGVNRLDGEVGRCGVGALARIASVCDHHGEEPALSGSQGAGTVFFAGCNLKCAYCQNYQISGESEKFDEYSAEKLAGSYMELQLRGCHNLELVSPSHVIPQLVEALVIACQRGFNLPVVYNTNGYDAVGSLELLEGIVDIYLPDLKYTDKNIAMRYSHAPNYPDTAIAAIREMYRQVGDLVLDEQGTAKRGLIVRHLVLPNKLAGTREALRRLAEEVSPSLTVSLMAQYYPTHSALAMPELARTVTAQEYDEALDAFDEAGLENGWAQELPEAPESYRPDFNENHPFS